MGKRKYSVEEIDAMRGSVRCMFPSGVSYRREERTKEIEERLRTYMVNGTTPEELSAAAQDFQKREYDVFRQRMECERRFRQSERTGT
jgi:hypothetical protein